jgi:hypothetical protein
MFLPFCYSSCHDMVKDVDDIKGCGELGTFMSPNFFSIELLKGVPDRP